MYIYLLFKLLRLLCFLFTFAEHVISSFPEFCCTLRACDGICAVGAVIQTCYKVSRHYSVKALQCQRTTVSRHYSVKALQCQGTTVSRHYSVKALQCQGTTASRHYSVKALQRQGTTVARHYSVKALQYQGTTVSMHYSELFSLIDAVLIRNIFWVCLYLNCE